MNLLLDDTPYLLADLVEVVAGSIKDALPARDLIQRRVPNEQRRCQHLDVFT